eukprot:XP_020407725.1 vegetative cell wall protein gp1-like [Zea mays]
MVPASSLTAAADKISPLAQKASPFTPATAVDVVVATADGTTTICPSPDPATHHRPPPARPPTCQRRGGTPAVATLSSHTATASAPPSPLPRSRNPPRAAVAPPSCASVPSLRPELRACAIPELSLPAPELRHPSSVGCPPAASLPAPSCAAAPQSCVVPELRLPAPELLFGDVAYQFHML